MPCDEAGSEKDGVVRTRPFAPLPCQGSLSRRGCRAADEVWEGWSKSKSASVVAADVSSGVRERI